MMGGMMDIGTLVSEFKRRRTDASDSGTSVTGKTYAGDIYPPATYTDGGSGKHGERPVKAWVPWLWEHEQDPWETDSGDVRRYLRHLSREDYADGSRENRLKAISMFYQEIYKMYREGGYQLPEKLIERIEHAKDIDEFNPAHGIDRGDFGLQGSTTSKKTKQMDGPNEVSYLNDDELKALEENASEPKTRNELIIRLLWTTGLRQQELARLRLSGIDEDERIIEVPAVKGDSGRRTRYPAKVDPLLKDWLSNYRPGVHHSSSPYLFPTNKGEHITGEHVNTIVKEAAESAGIQEELDQYVDGRVINRVTAHSLRHTYGVKAVKSDIDVRTLQKLMGHADIETTERYLDIADDDLMTRAARFDPNV